MNITDDETYISTSQKDWAKHYEEIFQKMTGKNLPPQDVKILYFSGKL